MPADRRRPRHRQLPPSATSSCSRTRSYPETHSVTACSTCNVGVISTNQKSPAGSSRNSTRPHAHEAQHTDREDRRPAQLLTQCRVDRRGRRLLDDRLVAALHRALPLTERDHCAECVGDDRYLDVAGILDVPLADDRAVADRPPPAGGCDRLGQGRRVPDHAHALPATARGRFDQYREVGHRLRVRPASAAPARRPRPPVSFVSIFSSGAVPTVLAGGPTQIMPASATAAAKSGSSASTP